MLLPASYLLRNLLRRATRSCATILGVAAATTLVIAMHSFAAGITTAAASTARDDTVVLLGVGAEVDLVRSVIPRGSAEAAAAAAPGVLTVDGIRAASVELHIATRQGDRVGLLRGVTPAAYVAHPQVTVVDGREPRQPFEIMVGALAATRMDLPPASLSVGSTLELERREFRIVGRFAAPGSPAEAEIWGRLEDIMLATRREDVSCVVLRLERTEALPELRLFASRRLDLEITALTERELQQELADAMVPIAQLARWMAVLAVLAATFACSNTMFAAVLARTRELATLRALGFSPLAVGIGLLQEALLVAFVGGALGLLAVLWIGSVQLRYPMGALLLEPGLEERAVGLLAALGAGLLGGLVPAIRAVRLPLLDALGGHT